MVKSVGPQISGIRGISGATILGDGRIVIILDIGALVRAEWRTRAQAPPPVSKDRGDRRVFAMVVDDSITVRRVTQRLLERNGMRVLTARDGMDAVALLQDNVPDVILLDIEMPRMDGYEVAAHVRNDPRLKQIPIVMITSRVSEKHRARETLAHLVCQPFQLVDRVGTERVAILGGIAAPIEQRDILLQLLLSVFAQVLDLFPALKAAGIDHPHPHKDKVFEVGPEQEGHGEHRLDPRAVEVADEARRSRCVGVAGRHRRGIVRHG